MIAVASAFLKECSTLNKLLLTLNRKKGEKYYWILRWILSKTWCIASCKRKI